jgi:putative amide transporter protein
MLLTFPRYGVIVVGTVGLFYVGAVLFINGLLLLGKVDSKAAGVFNLFVGALQVVTPTYLIIAANGNAKDIFAASGIYLFGFTYLYVGIGLLAKLDTTGVGWFSLFVAVAACGYSAQSFKSGDQPFGVIWLYWAYLWFLFFLLLGLKLEWLTRYTGWLTGIEGWVTAAIPAYMMMTGLWVHTTEIAIALGALGVVLFVGLYPLTTRRPATAVEPPPVGQPAART